MTVKLFILASPTGILQNLKNANSILSKTLFVTSCPGMLYRYKFFFESP